MKIRQMAARGLRAVADRLDRRPVWSEQVTVTLDNQSGVFGADVGREVTAALTEFQRRSGL